MDENGRRKNQLNEIGEYASEAKATERGRVRVGAGPPTTGASAILP